MRVPRGALARVMIGIEMPRGPAIKRRDATMMAEVIIAWVLKWSMPLTLGIPQGERDEGTHACIGRSCARLGPGRWQNRHDGYRLRGKPARLNLRLSWRAVQCRSPVTPSVPVIRTGRGHQQRPELKKAIQDNVHIKDIRMAAANPCPTSVPTMT